MDSCYGLFLWTPAMKSDNRPMPISRESSVVALMATKKEQPKEQPKEQRGSILLMTMIIMLVMVFSGLFVMEMAILEEITVSNEQRTLQVYQTAYSELEAQMDYLEANPNLFSNALAGEQTLPIHMHPTGCTVDNQPCQTATLRFTGEVPPPAGYSVGKFKGMAFEIDSLAVLESTGVRSSQTISVIYITQK